MKVCWRSPSNIALIKYWGKKKGQKQIPHNSSLSLTLKNSYTEMTVDTGASSGGLPVEFFFDGGKQLDFQKKIQNYLESLYPQMPQLKNFQLKIESFNSFPHSCGIASSASSMSALALCLLTLSNYEGPDYFQRASQLARLASGSACRSLFGPFVAWGKQSEIVGSSDDWGTPLPPEEIHPQFFQLQNAILLVDSQIKDVSSRAGHALMDDHPYAQVRYLQAEKNMVLLRKALTQGDFSKFSEVVEEEAMSLHALMMMSRPSYTLMKPNTLSIIQKIRQWRQRDVSLPITFTMDAGPNIHLLYLRENRHSVQNFIKTELVPFLEGGKWLEDELGGGPQLVSFRK